MGQKQQQKKAERLLAGCRLCFPARELNVWQCKIQCVCAFNAIPAHSGIVKSPLSKLLNGVATRAKALVLKNK